MSFNRGFYTSNKEIIEKIAEKLKVFYKEIEKESYLEMGSKISPEQLEEIASGAALQKEEGATYSVFANSYDPRFGNTLVVYAPMPKITDKAKIKEILKKYFGDCAYRTNKALCKKTSYRNFNENAIDVVFEEDVNSNTRLNIIFNDTSLKDEARFAKYWAKRPVGVIY